ncbi:TonB-dependent receptor domain-containing protein [Chroococcidiopsis sp. CCNUC1]|jgi:iron complex outermembrane recepter protein|uniref:TonB-dependent receptor domain-containing protein n=1 Tax=Chroococcidiopsis sp. CCNUC1 TaxID=2653189 RepID=UPI002020D77D|nr:TonB-dependent receptor [Chroococcidiopsis sp. CCNUC1]URD48555.1 TonB-dependent receptor [Chroococcidiopsis sp. CCNUC1]
MAGSEVEVVKGTDTKRVSSATSFLSDRKSENSHQTLNTRTNSQIPRLSDLKPTLTNASWLTQQPSPNEAGASEAIEVTGVRLKPTEQGLEVLLETATGQQLQATTTSENNNLIADIPNAQLRLPDGKTFRQDKPANGIDAVIVTQQTENSIRVTITGTAELPQAEVNQSAQGLVLSVTASPELEITVTSEKIEQNLQDVPASITAITGEEVRDSGVTSTRDVAKFTPNFSTLRSNGGRTRATYNIRGLGNTSSINSSGGSAVGLYVDGVPYSDWFSYESALNGDDIERIEVLRGPQGSLYGQNTQGGVINVITEPPGDVLELGTSATIGDPGLFDGQVTLKGPFQPEESNLFFSLSGLYGEQDGFVRNTFLDRDVDTRQNYSFRGLLRWFPPEENWDVRLSANYEQYNDGSLFTVPLDASDRDEIQNDFEGENTVYTNNQALTVTHKGSDFDFTSITARRQWNNLPGSADGDSTIQSIASAGVDIKTLSWSQEFRFQSPADSQPWQWVVGAFLEDKDTDINLKTTFGADAASIGFPLPPGATQSSPSDFQDTTYALFSQATYQATPQLSFTTGIRFETRDFSIDRRQLLSVGGVTAPTADDINLEDNESIVLPRFVMEYKFNPDLSVYGSVARGYKNGGFSTLPRTPEETQFERETSWSYEAGLKSAWFNNRLIANLAVFYTSVQDYQVIGFIPPNVSTVVNANGVGIWGAELELRAQPLQGLDLIASFGFVDAEFTDFTDPGTGEDYEGNKVIRTPEYTLFLAAQYRSTGGFFSRLELQGFGTYYFEPNNRRRQDPFALINARIGYEFDNFGIYLFGNNLFDKDYFTEAFDSFIIPGLALGTVGDGRTFGVQLRGNF